MTSPDLPGPNGTDDERRLASRYVQTLDFVLRCANAVADGDWGGVEYNATRMASHAATLAEAATDALNVANRRPLRAEVVLELAAASGEPRTARLAKHLSKMGLLPTLAEQPTAAAPAAPSPLTAMLRSMIDPEHTTRQITERCSEALDHHDGHPAAAWSTGEQLAVALVLHDEAHLQAMDYTAKQAVERIAGDLGREPDEIGPWLYRVRTDLGVAP